MRFLVFAALLLVGLAVDGQAARPRSKQAAKLFRVPMTKVQTVRRRLQEVDTDVHQAGKFSRRFNSFAGFPEPLSNYMGNYAPLV